ncbi:Crp/Fnr family transcriptional regulator [Pedobacter sp. KBW06]|uniref:Crp/Fnr family transcriptional regulator n=1 Tax=Pedobacter sp. KBW06 TaxID=2153359 RepID=UPI000F59F479|nr:Crp/Fnr family transcriptional regulator [Pedobacter sp. KBW06]RQO74333.1 Crp/Fnr family transcriptional regulator [Pedobacter sp. KBW06]
MAFKQRHFLNEIFKEQNFKSEELELVLQQFQRVEFAKNDFLVREGQVGNFYYFLEQGFARSYSIDLRGVDITTNFFSTKDIVIDWQSYFLKSHCRENIQAITPCIAWKITFGDFMKLFKIEAFREVGRTNLIKSYFELKSHSLSAITSTATERYLALIADKTDIVQNVPLKQIATYLGIADTSLSRIRNAIAGNK